MRSIKTLKTLAAAMMMAGLSASAFALTPGSGTWVKEANLFGLQDAQVYVPKNAAPATIGKGRALMLTLHGCAQTASGNVINKKFNWEDTAEKYGMVVIAPTVPSGTTATRTYSGCWDWFGGNHSRTTRDEAILLKLVDAVKVRAGLDIDPNQIYVTGLSSGGGVTNSIGCVAPDVFAGVGDNAGPALYTAASAGVGSKAQVTAQQVSSVCTQIAGSYSTSLKTQLFAGVNGTSDATVDPTHTAVEVAGMKLLYGASTSNGAFTDVKSTGESWKDAAGKTRVSYVQATGMAHAWPAGAGGSGGGTYVDYTHVNFPAYVTKFFFDNNLRVGPSDPAPVVSACAGSAASSTSATITGAATDNGSVASYSVVLNGATAVNDTAAGSGASFSKTYSLASGYYTGSVTATDNLGQASSACSIAQFLIGAPPAIPAPSGLAVGAKTTTSIALSWNAVSGATGYNVYRNGAKLTASPVTATSYTDSGLTASTTYSYTVTTVASSESAASAAVSATTAAAPPPVAYSQSVTATVVTHYSAGRLNLNQYLTVGAKYGYVTSITLYLCGTTWTNSASCGPLQ
jgi:poly(3-hydroxybutyrate) depolymerase